VKTCGFCGWSHPKGETPCVHVVRGPLTLLSPPHRRTKPVVPDIEGHDSAASVMPWATRRWPTRQVEPEESGNIRQGRERALAEAIRASGNPRINDWGRHNDPVKGLPVGGVILYAQPDSAGAWAWMRQNGVAWDDTERKGAIPAGRRRDVDVGNAAGDDGLVDPAKLLHPRWRGHVAEPDAFLARWARQTVGRLDRVLVVGDEYIFNTRRHRDVRLRKPRAPKATRKWPRFSPTMLSDEARAKWELDNNLDYAMELGRRRLNLGTYTRGDQLERDGRDGGWARTFGAHEAGKLLARRRALQRVEADVDARLAGHHDAATAAKADLEKLIDTVNDAAQRLPDKDIFDTVHFLLNARDPNGELGATERVLVWMAEQWGIKTDVARNVLASTCRCSGNRCTRGQQGGLGAEHGRRRRCRRRGPWRWTPSRRSSRRKATAARPTTTRGWLPWRFSWP
jgi:hypothetical protein